ncbi:HEAT repeat domain-containing protein [Actinomadura sp. KC216]|nr:HEAT repeat domain-containing protein [Actinomadura sp. KC216]
MTAAADVQTVRQALLALGHAGGQGAAQAIAACLDHPNMNVKKTAAAVLAHTGTPAVVPKLLTWLGRHDNPGLRAELTRTLRAILGDGFAATVVAAADRTADTRTRMLLVESLSGSLSERAIRALAAQGSPAGQALLAALPDPGTEPSSNPVDELANHGWTVEAARQAVELHEKDPDAPGLQRMARLRPMLPHWLDLAVTADRDAVLRLTMRLCPPPWSPDELQAFARALPTLAAGLAEIGPPHHPQLLALIGEAVACLPDGRAPEIAERIRALPVLGAPELTLLRQCGGVPTCDDLERALSATPTGEEAVLREAFALGPRPPDGHPLNSRERLEELIKTFPTADTDTRRRLLDQMLELQPLGAPPWTLTEQARRPSPDDTRAPHPGDLDQPRSQAQRERLLTMLDDPTRSATAAHTLLSWPEPETRVAVLRAYLRGKLAALTITDRLARALHQLDETELREASGDVQERLVRLATDLDAPSRAPLIPLLLDWWTNGSAKTRTTIEQFLRGAHPDQLAEALAPHLDAGAWGVLDLLKGTSIRRTPPLTRAWQRLHAEERENLTDRITLLDGPLRDPDAAAEDAAVLAALRDRSHAPTAHRKRPSHHDLLHKARTGTPAQIRQALDQLAEAWTEGNRDRELADLLIELIGHSDPAVRLRAHRIARRVLDRPAYLEQTIRLLDDNRSTVVVSAAKTLSHARWEPAIPALVALLTHKHPTVRRAAADGLVLIGEPAASALTHASARARPDRTVIYTTVLHRITAQP